MKRNTNVVRTKEEVTSWYKEYVENHMTLREINLKYATDASYQFKKFGFKSANPTTHRRRGRIAINTFFEEVGTEEEAYFLGLFFADGSLSKDSVKISLSKKDKGLLLKVRRWISPDSALHRDKNNLALILNSHRMVENLKKLGATTNKTYEDFRMPEISEKLQHHFIRGYFDGDGSIFQYEGRLKFNICSITLNILEDFKIIFEKKGIFNSYINTENRKGKTFKMPGGYVSTNCRDMHRLFVGRKKSLEKLYDFLYKDATLYLKRKREIFNRISQH